VIDGYLHFGPPGLGHFNYEVLSATRYQIGGDIKKPAAGQETNR
jgi:hypothetical protein